MTHISVLHADITTLNIQAIVNSANQSLLGGHGVDGAIHKAAGKKLLQACRRLKGCEIGMAKVTKAYDLQSQYIIHTVGPIWQGGTKNEELQLASCYKTSLDCAQNLGIKSIAFPAISCGIHGFPLDKALRIAIQSVREYLATYHGFEHIIFVDMNETIVSFYQQLIKQKSIFLKTI
ncbi:MAG: O-acetyl-ADP-ribose deacetylase [Spirochaetia bacterium]